MPDPSSLRPPVALPQHTIDLWLADYQQFTDPLQLHRLQALLSGREREQEAAFRFADDRLRYRVTRALVRTVLSQYATAAAVAPAAWEFGANPYGRPHIAAHHGLPGLHFNLSHTRGLIALAVGPGAELGVDVEDLGARHASPGIAEQFFSPHEAAALAAVPEARRPERFFEYWTCKEAYIKARGMGLSLPLDRFSIHFHGERAIGMTAAADIDDDPGRWCFWQCRPSPQHLLALCAPAQGGAAPTVTVRRMNAALEASPCDTAWLKETRYAMRK